MNAKKVRKKAAGVAILGLFGKFLVIGLDRCGSECLFCVIVTERKFVDVPNDAKVDYAMMERFELSRCRSYRKGKFRTPV